MNQVFQYKCFLSIIIPCYNVEAFLPNCIATLSKLKEADDVEFIFVNDGSIDDSLKLIEDFALTDKRVICINQNNQGVSCARNHAIEKSSGKYLFCLDPDDYLDDNAVIVIKEKIKDSDALLPNIKVVKGGTSYLREHHIKPGILSPTQLYNSCSVFPLAPKWVYRSSIVKEHGIAFDPNIKTGEVYGFTVSFLQFASSISVIEDSFNYYLRHAEGASLKPNYLSDLSCLRLLKQFDKVDKEWSKSPCFINTAFKIVVAFTYSKYLRCKISDPNAKETICKVLSDNLFKSLMWQVIIGRKSLFSERVRALYMFIMPSNLGYDFLRIINN